MRTSGSLKYPDAVACAFMPCLFIVEGTSADALEVAVTFNGVTHTAEHDTFNGSAYIDMREYIQGFYVATAPTYAARQKSPHAITVSYVVRSRSGSTYTTLLSSGSSLFVYGYLAPGETINDRVNYTWFRGHLFFVDVFASSSTTCTITDGGSNSQSVSLTSAGWWHVYINSTTFAAATAVYLTCGGVTYTLTPEDCDTGVYLRFLDRHGRICHYLFKQGEDERRIESADYFRPNLRTWNENGWSGWDGHRERKTRSRALKIGAPLVDSDTWEMLCDLASSPLVEMQIDTEDWVSVRIDEGTWKKSKAALQDFECTILFDEVELQ